MPDYTGREGEPNGDVATSTAQSPAAPNATQIVAAGSPLVLERDVTGKLTPASKVQLRAYAGAASVMRESETTGRLYSSLAKAQAKFLAIETNKEAKIKSKKGEESNYSFRYATLDQVLEAVRPALSEEGVVLMQPVTQVSGATVLVTRLVLGIDTPSDGSVTEWVEVVLPLRMSEDYQTLASAITYLRRLSLSAFLGIAADQDDDGNRASKREQRYSIEDKAGGGPNWPEMNFDLNEVDTDTEMTLVQLERQLIRATDMLDVGSVLEYWNRRSPLMARARKQHPGIEIFLGSAFYEGTHKILGRRLANLLAQAIRLEKPVDANFLEIALRDESARAALVRLEERHSAVAKEFDKAIKAELARLPDRGKAAIAPAAEPASERQQEQSAPAAAAEVAPKPTLRRRAPKAEAPDESSRAAPAEQPEQGYAASEGEQERVAGDAPELDGDGSSNVGSAESGFVLLGGDGDTLAVYTMVEDWAASFMEEWTSLGRADRVAMEQANDRTLRLALDAIERAEIDAHISDDLHVHPPLTEAGTVMVAAYISTVRSSLEEAGLVTIRRWEEINRPIYTAPGMPLTLVKRIATELEARRAALGLAA